MQRQDKIELEPITCLPHAPTTDTGYRKLRRLDEVSSDVDVICFGLSPDLMIPSRSWLDCLMVPYFFSPVKTGRVRMGLRLLLRMNTFWVVILNG